MRVVNPVRAMNQETRPKPMANDPDIVITIDCEDWNDALADAEGLARAAAKAAFQTSATDPSGAEIGIMLSDDQRVRTLNHDYRGLDKPTNVLSFASDDVAAVPAIDGAPRLLGDVIVAYGVAITEAKDEDKTLADHFSHLIVHGVLHLLGYAHIDNADAKQMEALEVSILAGLGVDDPYGAHP